MTLSSLEIRKRILKKMVRHSWWGEKHTAYDNVPRSFPKHLWGAVRTELDQLIKEGFIVEKPTGYGLHVSMNTRMKPKIEHIVFGV